MSSLGVIKSHLAWRAEDGNYVGLPRFQKGLAKKYKASQILIKKEGAHRLGVTIGLSSLVLVAAGCAIGLFIIRGHEAYFPGGCLATVSAVCVAAIVATWVLTTQEQKKLQSQFDEKANVIVPIQDALLAVRHADVQTALALLDHLPSDHDAELVQTLLQIVETPMAPEQAEICMRHPQALTHLIAQNEEYAGSFRELVKQHPSARAFALLVQALPSAFKPQTIFVVYATWTREKQNQFLQELVGTRTNPAACDALVAYLRS